MQKTQATKKPAPRRKPTNAELKERRIDKMAFKIGIVDEPKEHVPFKWSDLDSFHDDCQSLFLVCNPIIDAIRSTEIQEKLKAKGTLEQFTKLASRLATDVQGYTDRLDTIRSSYKDRVVTEQNEPEEMMHGFTVAEDYRQWIDSFQAVIVAGLAADLTILIDELN